MEKQRASEIGCKLQKKLASVGYAPEVKSGVIAVKIGNRMGWGYITQTARVARNLKQRTKNKILKKWKRSVGDFAEECKQILFGLRLAQWEKCTVSRIFNDMHDGNWGAVGIMLFGLILLTLHFRTKFYFV